MIRALLLLSLFSSVTFAGDNLVSNPSFEESDAAGNASGWRVVSEDRYRCEMRAAVDKSMSAHGNASLKLFNFLRGQTSLAEKFSTARVESKFIPVDADKTYVARLRIRKSDPKLEVNIKGVIELIRDDTGTSQASAPFLITKKVGDWLEGETTITPDQWKAFTKDVPFKWSMVRFCVAVFIYNDLPKDFSINLDDLEFYVKK